MPVLFQSKGRRKQQKNSLPSLVILDFRLSVTSSVGLEVHPSVEFRELVENVPEVNQQITPLSSEELTGCSPWSCPSSAGL